MTEVHTPAFPVRICGGLTTLLAIALWVLGCGGGGGPTGGSGMLQNSPSGAFSSSGTSASPDLVRLTSSAASGNLVTVQVSLAGPTTSTDIYSFAFDVVLEDPAVARYVAGTATVGSVLQATTGQGTSVLASQQANRVVVGVTKTGGGAGNGIPSGESAIVSLTFEVIDVGACGLSIEGPPGAVATPQALDASGTPIGSIHFDTAQATLVGS